MERKQTEGKILKSAIVLLVAFGIVAMSTNYFREMIYWDSINEANK